MAGLLVKEKLRWKQRFYKKNSAFDNLDINLFGFHHDGWLCVYPFSCEEGSNLFGYHSGSILSNRAETSQDCYWRRQPEEILTWSNLG